MGRTGWMLAGLVLVAGMLSGCGHGRDAGLAREELPGSVDVAEVLGDLAAQAGAVQGFEARRVKVNVRGPGLEAEQILPQSTVYFQHPSALHVVGRKLGRTYVKITVAEDSFLLELPGENEFYVRGPGESFSASAPEARPGDVVRELFAPVDWGVVDPAQVEVLESGELVRLGISDAAQGVAREIVVERAGEQWVLVESVLMQGDETLAVSRLGGYEEVEGVLFPMEAGLEFPGEGAALRFRFETVTINGEMPGELFDVEAQLAQLAQAGYRELEPF